MALSPVTYNQPLVWKRGYVESLGGYLIVRVDRPRQWILYGLFSPTLRTPATTWMGTFKTLTAARRFAAAGQGPGKFVTPPYQYMSPAGVGLNLSPRTGPLVAPGSLP